MRATSSELVYPKVRYIVYTKFLPPYVPPMLCSKLGMFEYSKKKKKSIDDGAEAYLIDQRMKTFKNWFLNFRIDKKIVASLLLRRESSTTTIQRERSLEEWKL